jgi:hypothetical protein
MDPTQIIILMVLGAVPIGVALLGLVQAVIYFTAPKEPARQLAKARR